MFVDYWLLIKYFLCISSNLKVESQLNGGMVLLSAFQKLKLLKQVGPNKLLSLPIEREMIWAEPLKKIKVSNYKIIPVSNKWVFTCALHLVLHLTQTSCIVLTMLLPWKDQENLNSFMMKIILKVWGFVIL